MNETKSHSNESDSEDRMTKKDLKKMKVITYTNKTPRLNVFYLEQFYVA